MGKIFILILFSIFGCFNFVFGIEISNSDGVIINYEIDSSHKTAEVIQLQSGEYGGNVVIPDVVEVDDVSYLVTSIGYSAFLGCNTLTSVVIPNSVVYIHGSAFKNCNGLVSVEVGNSVRVIEDFAFYVCSSLTAITLPRSVTEIGYSAFYGCSSLITIAIPESVTDVGASAFENCVNLSSVVLEDGDSPLSFHNYDCFKKCPIESLYVGRDLAEYDTSLFQNRSTLAKLIIGNSVTYIGRETFKGCANLPSVTIGRSVKRIGVCAFEDCTSLTSIILVDGEEPLSFHDYSYLKKCPIKSLYMGRNITSIPFSKTTLSELIVGDLVTRIGGTAFFGCSNLTSVSIGKSVTSIGHAAFSNCNSLVSIILNDGNTTLSFGDSDYSGNCFSNSPIKLLYMGRNIDYYCADNGYSYSPFSGTSLTELIIGDSVTDIGRNAFQYCPDLVSVKFGNSVANISDGAFQTCNRLTSVVFGNSVTDIGYFAFCDCGGLTSVTFGNSVNRIGNGAFRGCKNILEINVHNPVPPQINNNVFTYVDKKQCILNVPVSSLETYRQHMYWQEFINIKENDFSTNIINSYIDGDKKDCWITRIGNLIINGFDENDIVLIYDAISGKKVFQSEVGDGIIPLSFVARGVYVIQISDDIFKIIY